MSDLPEHRLFDTLAARVGYPDWDNTSTDNPIPADVARNLSNQVDALLELVEAAGLVCVPDPGPKDPTPEPHPIVPYMLGCAQEGCEQVVTVVSWDDYKDWTHDDERGWLCWDHSQ